MDGDADALMQHLCSQPYAIACGGVSAEPEAVCRLLDIEAMVT